MRNVTEKNYVIALDQGTTSSRAVIFDKDTNMFRYNGTLIETKEKHYQLMIHVFKMNNVNYEIDVFPEPF